MNFIAFIMIQEGYCSPQVHHKEAMIEAYDTLFPSVAYIYHTLFPSTAYIYTTSYGFCLILLLILFDT
jgi:hypothetical protein